MSALRRWLAIVMAIAVMLGTLLVPLEAAAAPIRKSGLPVPLREPMEPWAHGDPDQPHNSTLPVTESRGEGAATSSHTNGGSKIRLWVFFGSAAFQWSFGFPPARLIGIRE
jgi:hypothetical protein